MQEISRILDSEGFNNVYAIENAHEYNVCIIGQARTSLAEKAIDIRLRRGDHLVARAAVDDFGAVDSHPGVQVRIVGRHIGRPGRAGSRRLLPANYEPAIGFAVVHG